MSLTLNVHSEYSTLDGMCKLEEMILRAKELGQPAITCSDHGSTSGLYNFQQLCIKHGIKPILGTEFYYERKYDGKHGHLIAIAKSDKGLENIFKLQEFAYVENFYKKTPYQFR